MREERGPGDVERARHQSDAEFLGARSRSPRMRDSCDDDNDARIMISTAKNPPRDGRYYIIVTIINNPL